MGFFEQKELGYFTEIMKIKNANIGYDKDNDKHKELQEQAMVPIRKLTKLCNDLFDSELVFKIKKREGSVQPTLMQAWQNSYWKPFTTNKDYNGIYAIKLYFAFDKQNIQISIGTVNEDKKPQEWQDEKKKWEEQKNSFKDEEITKDELLKLSATEVKTRIIQAIENNIPLYNKIIEKYEIDCGQIIEEPKFEPKPNSLNQILYGPPGTGKTYSIKEKVNDILEYHKQGSIKKLDELAEKTKGKEDYTLAFTTFHPAYGYEEFIEGMRPVINKNNEDSEDNGDNGDNEDNTQQQGTIAYEIRDGVFKALCKQAKENPNEPYFMIIDEINRGNIPKIFGELITLIEDNKRAGTEEEISVILPYSQESFSVPNNVYIIGTMNTADKSLTALDTALRRRFRFIEMPPRYDLLETKIKENDDFTGKEVANMLRSINGNIDEREKHIGHSYLMNCKNDKDIKDALRYSIIPLLQEYKYDNWEEINKILFSDKKLINGKSEKICFKTIADNVYEFHFMDKKSKETESTENESQAEVQTDSNDS